jgi:hypothetical protein
MRRKWVLGLSLAVLTGGAVAGQQPFGSERVPPKAAPPAFPPGLAPVAPLSPTAPLTPGGAYVPPVGGLQPVGGSPTPTAPGIPGAPGTPNTPPPVRYVPLPVETEIKTALGKDHPWALKPEHGAYFILVKSYVRPAQGSKDAQEDRGLTARELAEGLATEIRDTYRVQAFLFEYITEERKAEMRQIAIARQKANAYITQLAALEQKAQLQGMEFMRPDNKIHVLTHNHRDQIGVLVGGFQSEADASKALAKLKTWPTPKNEMLVDKGAIVQPGPNGKSTIVTAAINPYATAFVVPNPTIARTDTTAKQGLDPFIVKLNEDNPYSLLKATKGWTLGVKSFSAPVEIVNKDSDTSLMKRMSQGKGAQILAASGEQAESMAKMLRQMKGPAQNGKAGQALNLEAFVLHTRYASIVTVGQFDGPDDPALVATKQMLAKLQATVTSDAQGLRPVANTPTLFDNVMPIPVPRAPEKN